MGGAGRSSAGAGEPVGNRPLRGPFAICGIIAPDDPIVAWAVPTPLEDTMPTDPHTRPYTDPYTDPTGASAGAGCGIMDETTALGQTGPGYPGLARWAR